MTCCSSCALVAPKSTSYASSRQNGRYGIHRTQGVPNFRSFGCRDAAVRFGPVWENPRTRTRTYLNGSFGPVQVQGLPEPEPDRKNIWVQVHRVREPQTRTQSPDVARECTLEATIMY